MGFDAYTLLVDFMLASIFLFAAKFLRERIKFLQSMFVPVSLLGGFLGLALGQNGFNIIRFSDKFGSYAGLLIIAVFVSIGLRGFNFSKGGFKTNIDRIGSYYCFRNIGWAFQYAMPIVFSMLFLKFLVPELNPAFGMALLRIVDPENKSCTLDDAAIITPLESIIEIFALATIPVACVQGNWLIAVIPVLIYLVALIIISFVFKWWHPHPKAVYDESQDA